MMLLYQYTSDQEEETQLPNYEIKVFNPSLLRWNLPKEKLSAKVFLVRMMFWFITRGKARIVYATTENDGVVHTSYVIPKCFKFPFLQRSDYEIGPCETNPQYRGHGIYPNVLRFICRSFREKNTTFYMIVNASNAASVHGIEKAGFKKCGTVRKSRLLKIYKK